MARPELTEAALEAALRNGAAAVVALFERATDKDRARLRPAVEAAAPTSLVARMEPARRGAVTAAILATYPPGKVAEQRWRVRWDGDPGDVTDEVLVGALRPRTARFKAALAKAALRSEWSAWGFVRPLVRGGVLDPAVDDDAYVRAMATGLVSSLRGTTTYDALLADPALLEREVWRLFEVPDALGAEMRSWQDALVRLAAEGRLDRGRLLDACLAGLGTDLRPGQLAWMASFWAGLAPTDEELRERADAVVALVASPEPAVVKLGLPLAGRVVDLGAADPAAVAELLRHPLGGSRKNLAMGALSLLDGLLQRAAGGGDTTRVEPLLAVAAAGLGHERADVAARALRLVRRHTTAGVPEGVRAELLGWVEVAPPTLRTAVAELAGVPAAAAVATLPRLHPADVPGPARPGPWAGITDERRVAPVEDLDELVALFAAALEGQGSADDAERALAGVVRLGAARPVGFADLVSPVRKRAATLLEGWGASGAPIEMARVVLAWADGRVPKGAGATAPPAAAAGLRALVGGLLARRGAAGPAARLAAPTPATFLRGRVAEIVQALARGGPAVTLSEPTHQGGRLDPGVLAARRAGRGRDGLGPYDRRQAGLRLPTGHEWPPPLRLDVVDTGGMAAGNPSAVRFVRDTPPDGAPPDPLVAAAERYFAHAGVERFNASIFRPFWDVVSDGLGTRLAVTTFAGRPDVPAAMATVGLAERARQAMVHWVDPLPMIEALLDPAVPLDGATTALLALAVTGDTEYRAAGVDAAVAAVGDGRFDPVALARATATLHRADVLVLTRLARPVADLAASGPVHLLRAQQYLLAVVESLGGHASGLHGPLEALAQLSAGGIVVPEPAGRVLRSLAERPSKAGRAAATVVANAVVTTPSHPNGG